MQNHGFLGGDISKGICDFKLLDHQGEVLENTFQLDDNQEGHEKLLDLLQDFKKRYQLKKIVVGLESTGGYENNWYNRLRRKQSALSLEVFRINPKKTFHQYKTEGKVSIDDGVSAETIASYLQKHYGHNDLTDKRLNPSQKQDSKKRLHKYIESQVRQNTRTKNQLEKLLYSHLPELLSIKPEKYTNWFLELLIAYPSKKAILHAGIEQLTKIKYLTKSKAQQMIDALKKSVGSLADPIMELTIQSMARDIKTLTEKIKGLRASLANQCRQSIQMSQQIDIACSIAGIAIDTAVAFLLEMGDIERFEKGANLVAFWGINPCEKQSGDKSWKSKMSKQGSRSARATMFLAAQNVVKYEPYFKAIYAKQMKKGKTAKVALGVVMSKLTRVLYGMLKNKSKFEAGIDQLNQTKKTKAKNKELKTQTKRRYQPISKDAPLSTRQRKKRKQEQMPQIDTIN